MRGTVIVERDSKRDTIKERGAREREAGMGKVREKRWGEAAREKKRQNSRNRE